MYLQYVNVHSPKMGDRKENRGESKKLHFFLSVLISSLEKNREEITLLN